MKRFDVADFFCGAGGFSEGFRQKGFNVVFGLDNWKPAIDTHKLNHPECKHALMDILELDTPEKIDEVVPDVDILIGSPPCVSFSGSNKAGKADKSLGLSLIKAYLRIISWKKSKGKLKYWLLENVPNSEKFIKDEYSWDDLGLPGKGPNLKIEQRNIFNAADYGTPQTRKRFVCGDYPLPQKTCKDETEWMRQSVVMDSLTNPLSSKIPKKVKDPVYGFEISGSDLTDHFYDSRIEEFEWKMAKRLKEDHGFMGKMSFPEDICRPSRTVMATRSASTRESMVLPAFDSEGKNIGYRLPTIREIASFMSFPVTYQFEAGNESSKYRLVGNAVCAKLSGALAEAIAIKEGIRPSDGFLPLPSVRPSFDLTGTKTVAKRPGLRRFDAKFAMHIPYLKIRSFRVELNNLESEFESGRIVWSSVLHHGTGKGALKCKAEQQHVENLLGKAVGFSAFAAEVKETFHDVRTTSAQLQESYNLNGSSKELGPERALEMMRGLVDKHFPEVGFSSVVVGNRERVIGIEKNDIPLRILAGLYACNHFVDGLKK